VTTLHSTLAVVILSLFGKASTLVQASKAAPVFLTSVHKFLKERLNVLW